MIWHFHKWSKWEDSKPDQFPDGKGGWAPAPNIRVHAQTRRCSVCNIIEERRP